MSPTHASKRLFGREVSELRSKLEMCLYVGIPEELRSSARVCRTCSEALGDAAGFVEDVLSRHLEDSHNLSEVPSSSRAGSRKS